MSGADGADAAKFTNSVHRSTQLAMAIECNFSEINVQNFRKVTSIRHADMRRAGPRPARSAALLDSSRGVDAMTVARDTPRSESPYRPRPLVPEAVLDIARAPPSRLEKIRGLLLRASQPYADHYCGIALLADGAPGLGHQSAVAQAYRELRERIGFLGPLLIAVDCWETALKLTRMASFDSQVQIAPQEDVKRVRLLICPALDTDENEGLESAFFGESDLVLMLQPYTWSEDRWVYSIVDGQRRPLRIDSDAAAYQPVRANYVHIGAWFAKHMRFSRTDALTHSSVDAITLLTHGLKQEVLATCTVYGRDSENVLSMWVQSIFDAQGAHLDSLPGVLLLWLNEDLPDALPVGVGLRKFDDPEIVQDIHRMMRGTRDIVLWHVGHVPQRVFNELVALSSLPSLNEGCNTSNLARSLQRPYISTYDDFGIGDSPTPEAAGACLLRHASVRGPRDRGLMNGEQVARVLVNDAAPLSLISEFLRASQLPGSDVCSGYARAGRQSCLPSSDQLQVGLAQLAGTIQEAPL